MLKKQRLAAMEGKHHDAKPRYTRKGRADTAEPSEAEVFNRIITARAAAGDPSALALIASLEDYMNGKG